MGSNDGKTDNQGLIGSEKVSFTGVRAFYLAPPNMTIERPRRHQGGAFIHQMCQVFAAAGRAVPDKTSNDRCSKE